MRLEMWSNAAVKLHEKYLENGLSQIRLRLLIPQDGQPFLLSRARHAIRCVSSRLTRNV